MKVKRLAYHTEAKVKQADIEDVVGISCLTMLEELESVGRRINILKI